MDSKIEEELKRIEKEIQRQADEIAKLRDAVRYAAQIFRTYEGIHRAKGTPEGDEKANINGGYAILFENQLKRRFYEPEKGYRFRGTRDEAIDTIGAFICDSIREGAFATDEDWFEALGDLLKENEVTK